jgi:hypothetical protein
MAGLTRSRVQYSCFAYNFAKTLKQLEIKHIIKCREITRGKTGQVSSHRLEHMFLLRFIITASNNYDVIDFTMILNN